MDDEREPELWVELVDVPGRCLLVGNSHTVPGRMFAWSEELGRDVTFSMGEVTASSEASSWWIKGFLAGAEPSVERFLGVSDESTEPQDDASYGRWRAAMQAFRNTGEAPPLNRRPVWAVSPVAELLLPWALSGGEIWVWRDGRWSVDASRPAPIDEFLPESVCFERGVHEMVFHEPCHLVCEDCGFTVEVES